MGERRTEGDLLKELVTGPRISEPGVPVSDGCREEFNIGIGSSGAGCGNQIGDPSGSRLAGCMNGFRTHRPPAQRVALKMGWRLRCSSVTYRLDMRPPRALPGGPF
jgi:hypothetical protein